MDIVYNIFGFVQTGTVQYYQCDACDSYPLTVCRYHCLVCSDYDLCETCFKEGTKVSLVVKEGWVECGFTRVHLN